MTPATNLPRFSIVIPTYARPVPLAACMRALDRLTYPRDRFEVIVVDDGSPAPPRAVVEPYRSRLNVRLQSQPNAGPATARNTGAARAGGEFIAFTDDDCAPAADWLDRLAAAFAAAPDALVGGRVVNRLDKNVYSAASQALISYLYQYYNADGRAARFLTSNNFATCASHFRDVGGFDTTYPRAGGEDREFCDRWLHLGHPMVYAPDVVINHFHHLSMRSFCRQHFNYGRGAFSFHAARARRDAAPMKVEPLTFYTDMLSFPFRDRETPRGRAAALSALMFVSQVANTLGFFVGTVAQAP